MSKRKGKKIGFVPNGRMAYLIVLFGFFLCCLTGMMLLLEGFNETSLYFWIMPMLFLPAIFFTVRDRYSSYLVISKNTISYKKKRYEWNNIFITLDYRIPNARNPQFYNYVAYFSDHYLTSSEIKSKEFKKRGIFLILTPKRIDYLLPLYQKKIKILRECPDDVLKKYRSSCYVLETIKKHNLEQDSFE